MSTKQATIIGVPFGLGGRTHGAAGGPAALRKAHLTARLQALNVPVHDTGDIAVAGMDGADNMDGADHRPASPDRPPAANDMPEHVATHMPAHLPQVRATCERLRDTVDHVLAHGHMPVVLGGDHSIAIGTISALSRHHARRGSHIGVVWLDAHGDANTPETSPTGNIHGMPLAVSLGLGPPALRAVGGPQRMIEGARTALVGLREADPGERDILRHAGVNVFDMDDIREHGMDQVMARAIDRILSIPDTAGIHVSIDMDCVDPALAPGVGTPVPGGLSSQQAHQAMRLLAATGKLVSVELVEVDPTAAPGNRTAELAVDLLAALLAPARQRTRQPATMSAP